jgi:acyl-CoA reductase-like NAD-dependent aldehyde dehydrogenase
MIRRFKEEIARRTDDLAKALTREMGKPIRQSRNELDALRERLDFFLLKTRSALAPETVLGGGKLSERITHEPLGVVANISAWNYPYFVGSNVFIPALLAGNTVLYKPSEHATITGLAIGDMMQAAGVPRDAFQVVVGAGEAGGALISQAVDGVFFTGSYATGAKVAARARRGWSRSSSSLEARIRSTSAKTST